MKIEIQNLCKTIKKVPILQDITVTFESGKIYGLKGKNGSGKTMLMRAISGLIIPNRYRPFMLPVALQKPCGSMEAVFLAARMAVFLPIKRPHSRLIPLHTFLRPRLL